MDCFLLNKVWTYARNSLSREHRDEIEGVAHFRMSRYDSKRERMMHELKFIMSLRHKVAAPNGYLYYKIKQKDWVVRIPRSWCSTDNTVPWSFMSCFKRVRLMRLIDLLDKHRSQYDSRDARYPEASWSAMRTRLHTDRYSESWESYTARGKSLFKLCAREWHLLKKYVSPSFHLRPIQRDADNWLGAHHLSMFLDDTSSE